MPWTGSTLKLNLPQFLFSRCSDGACACEQQRSFVGDAEDLQWCTSGQPALAKFQITPTVLELDSWAGPLARLSLIVLDWLSNKDHFGSPACAQLAKGKRATLEALPAPSLRKIRVSILKEAKTRETKWKSGRLPRTPKPPSTRLSFTLAVILNKNKSGASSR